MTTMASLRLQPERETTQEKSEDKNSSHAETKPYRMLKQVIQQGRRREITGGVPSGVR